MAKNVLERMKENNTDQKIREFRDMQRQDYDFKVKHAEEMAWRFFENPEIEGKAYVAVGGLDSITLHIFLHSIGIDIPAISVSSLEDKSIQSVHKALGIRRLTPSKREDGRYWTKRAVIEKFGFPILSKEIAGKIALLQHPSPKNATVRHAIITGETGEYGGNRKGTRMKLSQEWLELFGGPENEKEGTHYKTAPFLVSDKCCYYLKEKPCNDYARESGRFPYMGLMASEGGRREKALMINGCNYISKGTKRSAPFAIFNRQDILTLALEMDAYYHQHWEEFRPITVDCETGKITYGEPIHINTIVPAIYGEIAAGPDGMLRTTKAQRTGCSMCGFGVQMEGRPNRFDRLRKARPAEWDFWMKRIYKDSNGKWWGFGDALDYIGIGWKDDPHGNLNGQIGLFGDIEND